MWQKNTANIFEEIDFIRPKSVHEKCIQQKKETTTILNKQTKLGDVVSEKYTGWLKKLFPLGFLPISQLPLGLGI